MNSAAINEKVGFIGVGKMGSAVATVLLDKTPLLVFDLQHDRIAAMVSRGAREAADATDVARNCSVILTSLPRSEDVDELLFGRKGIALSLASGTVLVDLTTGDPTISRAIAARLAKQGVDFQDSSLAGGTDAVLAHRLTIFVGADANVYARTKPVLELITPNVFHVGAVGAGNIMKLTNNVIGSAIRVVTCEALLMAAKSGVALEAIAKFMPHASARTFFSDTAFPRYINGIYEARFAADLMIKDLDIVQRMAAESSTPMEVSEHVRKLYVALVSEFGKGTDVDMMLRLVEKRAGQVITGDRKE